MFCWLPIGGKSLDQFKNVEDYSHWHGLNFIGGAYLQSYMLKKFSSPPLLSLFETPLNLSHFLR